MATTALLLLLAGVAVMAATGWPNHAVLFGVACAIATIGVATGHIDPALLQALPARVVGILEHDLLQAIALYAFVAALLRHVDVAARIADAVEAWLRALRVPAGPRGALAGYAVGLLAAPLNGSVGAGVNMLAATAAPRWRLHGLPAPRALAFTAATATLGVLVPPSLVLILLGDAMMRAHTEGLQLGGITGVRVINTQDLIQACVPPAFMLATAWAGVVGWRARGPAVAAARARVTRTRATWTGVLAPCLVVLMLVAIAVGWLRAVEAAATAALALFVFALAGGQLGQGRLAAVLDDAMATTGALFALLLAATTLSLMLRAAGCDRLAADALAGFAGRPAAATAAVLGVLLVLAFALDAFELIFLVVPIVMPPLLALGVDAAWVACLALIVLQIGFLLPPWGYALVLARGFAGDAATSARSIAREAAPFVAVLVLLLALVQARPEITHWLRSAPDMLPAAAPTGSTDDLLREMSRPRDAAGSPP